MLDSAEVAVKPFLFEFQQNLDNCIGESGKTKHLIEARRQELQSLSQLVILFFESRDLLAFFQRRRADGSLIPVSIFSAMRV